MQVRWIEQSNQRNHVEQRDHALGRRLIFVPEPVHIFRRDDSRQSLGGQNWNPIAHARSTTSRRQCATGELGKNTPCGRSSLGGKRFGALQNVLVDIECGAHAAIHRASSIRCQRDRRPQHLVFL